MIRSLILAGALCAALAVLALTTFLRPMAPSSLSPTAAARLEALRRDPDLAGARVYEGAVSPLERDRSEVLYRYERRVRAEGPSLVSTHVTRDPSGAVVVSQRARHDAGYTLSHAEMIHAQAGTVSAVDVAGGRVRFTLERGGRVTTASEPAREPVVSGPTTFGYILAHWEELAAGHRLPVRFAVLERQQTIAFVLVRVPSQPGRTVIRMTPSQAIVRLLVAPTSFEFDSHTRHILGYAGRVPTLQRIRGSLQPMDARVSYAFTATSFL